MKTIQMGKKVCDDYNSQEKFSSASELPPKRKCVLFVELGLDAFWAFWCSQKRFWGFGRDVWEKNDAQIYYVLTGKKCTQNVQKSI